MSDARSEACSRCGRPVGQGTRCASCGKPLCHYDIRVLDGRELCPRCYRDATFQYHSKECDLVRR